MDIQEKQERNEVEVALGLEAGEIITEPEDIAECMIDDEGNLVKDGFNPRIFTRSGAIATVDNPPPLMDAAVCLARIPRFCGNTRVFWPVLCHLINAANIAYRMGVNEVIAHLALHDYSETLLGDIPSPFKTKDTKLLEKQVISSVFKRYNLTENPTTWSTITFIDRICLVIEAEELLATNVADFFGGNYAVSVGIAPVHKHLGRPFLKRLVWIAENDREAFDPEGWMVDLYISFIQEIEKGTDPREAFSVIRETIEVFSPDDLS
jgi:hypothetical protein